MVMEKLLLEVYAQQMGRVPRKPLLGQMLADNQFTRKIERRIVTRMMAVNDMGNLGLHGEVVECSDAVRVLDDLCAILDWYLQRPEHAERPAPTESQPAPALKRRPQDNAFSSHTIITCYPAPIAVAYRRFCDHESPTDRILKLFAVVEAVMRYLVVLGISDLFHCLAETGTEAGLPKSEAFDFLRNGQPMQMGLWLRALRETASVLNGLPERVLTELPDVCHSAGRLLDDLVRHRNRCIHHEASISIRPDECEDLFPSLRPLLEELLQHASLVCAYPLGFVRKGLGEPGLPGTYRYYFHSCMGARLHETEHASCEDIPVRLVEHVPFIVAPHGTRILYLWPLLLEKETPVTGRRTLYVFEDILDDHWPYLTKIRSTAIDVKESWRQELTAAPTTSHAWLLERLRQMPAAPRLPVELGLREKLQPAVRGQLAGQKLREGLQLTGALAAGGFGTIYVAEMHDIQGTVRRVAVKVLEVQDVKRELARFEREFDKLNAAADHPGIVRCFERGITRIGKREYPWYAMELAVGDLTTRIDARKENGVLPWIDPTLQPAVIREFRAVVQAVAHLHGLGIVHRDLKPGNVLVLESGELRLSDFGLVKNLSPSQLSLRGHPSSTAGIKGTVEYMAPEQFRGKKVGKAADVYALGIMLAELATGERFRKPATYPKNGSPLIRWLHVKRLPEALQKLVLDCTQVEPSRRPADAEEVLKRFEKLIGQEDAESPSGHKPSVEK
jgi:hypothetical protein